MIQNRRVEYSVIRSSARSFARIAHSFACYALVALFARSAALIRSPAHSLTRSWTHGKEIYVYVWIKGTSISYYFYLYSASASSSSSLARAASSTPGNSWPESTALSRWRRRRPSPPSGFRRISARWWRPCTPGWKMGWVKKIPGGWYWYLCALRTKVRKNVFGKKKILFQI